MYPNFSLVLQLDILLLLMEIVEYSSISTRQFIKIRPQVPSPEPSFFSTWDFQHSGLSCVSFVGTGAAVCCLGFKFQSRFS